MFNLKPTNSAETHRTQGLYHVVACRVTPGTKTIGDRLLPFLAELQSRSLARTGAGEAKVAATAERRQVEALAKDALARVRDEARHAETRSPGLGATRTLFPKSYRDVARRSGREWLEGAATARKALDHPDLAAVPELAALAPALDAATGALRVKVEAHEAADLALRTAIADERLAKTLLREQLERNFGRLVELVGKNRARLFFSEERHDERHDAPEAAPAASPALGVSPAPATPLTPATAPAARSAPAA